MTKPDRRQTHRRPMEALAYVNLAPDNGGLVLNVSEGGLSFQAVSPLQQHLGTIRFWCSLPDNHRIEAVGELAWTDATRKTGGLRLTSAPAEVRKQLLKLAGPQPPSSTDENLSPQVQAVLVAAAPTATQSEKDAAPASDGNLRQKPPLPETRVPAPLILRSNLVVAARRVEKPTSTVSRVRSPRLFHRAVAGTVILAVAGTAMVLNSHRRQVGVSLMQLGGWFAGTTLPQSVSPAAAPDSKSDPTRESLNLAAKEPEKQLQTQIDEADRKSARDPEEPQAPTLTLSQKRAIPLSTKVPNPSHAATEATTQAFPSSSMSAPTTSAPSSGTSSEAVGSSWFGSTYPLQDSPGSTGDSDVESASATRYFEVGNFKDALWAVKATEALAQSGFQAVVVRKGRLWMNSYHVLVGPFGTDAEAGTAQRVLESQGFKPRSTRIIPSKSQ